jgi:ABC1 atypical kinase-like domain
VAPQVAVKIQRPNILEQVALDMHLLRELSIPLKALFNLNTNVTGVIDDWGVGFVDELDYQKEARNAEVFMEAIEKTPLRDAVFAPPVVPAASSRRVLTTRWIDGEKLDQSSSADVAKLCSVAMNTYLTMMLECSILHCDPHPGNLKRTPDGRLCILDWGLVTSLPADLQADYIIHIAHLTSKDYAEVPDDLVKLGFVPRGKEKEMTEAGVVDVLTSVYTQFAGGGGAAKVDVSKVISELNGLSENYGNLFQLPPYFAYIARAFGVLEGIGLTCDPNYAIVGECLPYISRRLLTDSSTSTGEALDTFIFGAEKDKPDRVIDADRLEMLLSGFGKYEDSVQTPATLTSDAPAGRQASSGSSSSSKRFPVLTAARIEQAAVTLVDLLVADEPSLDPESLTPLQKLVLEETAKILGASARSTLSVLREASGKLPTGRSLLGSLFDPLGLLRNSALLSPDELDQKVLDAATKLVRLLQSVAVSGGNQHADADEDIDWMNMIDMTPDDARRLASSVARKLWDKRRGLTILGGHLTYIMLKQTASRLDAPSPSTSNVNARATSSDPFASRTGGSSASSGEREVVSVPESERLLRARKIVQQTQLSKVGAQ